MPERGEANPTAKLNDELAAKIKALVVVNVATKDIVKLLGPPVTKPDIWNIKHNDAWSHVPWPSIDEVPKVCKVCFVTDCPTHTWETREERDARIRADYADGMCRHDLANKYGLSPNTIRQIACHDPNNRRRKVRIDSRHRWHNEGYSENP